MWSYYNAYGARVNGWVTRRHLVLLEPSTGAMGNRMDEIGDTGTLFSDTGAMLTGWQHADGWYYSGTLGRDGYRLAEISALYHW